MLHGERDIYEVVLLFIVIFVVVVDDDIFFFIRSLHVSVCVSHVRPCRRRYRRHLQQYPRNTMFHIFYMHHKRFVQAARRTMCKACER